MPEHFHLLITEPEAGDPSVVMKVIKQRFARRVNRKGRLPHSGGTLVAGSGTQVLFSAVVRSFIFISEQFWGWAARASGDSRESGRPLNFWLKIAAFAKA